MTSQSSVKANLSNVLKTIAPEYYWQRKINYIKNNLKEVEMKLLPVLADKDQISIDVGAATGSFLVNLSYNSKHVIGFEPIPDNIRLLNQMIRYSNLHATVEPIALSNDNGIALLKMLENDFGRSTIEATNELSDNNNSKKTTTEVIIKKLDDYAYENIGFIKIDVEGHEVSVLEGAINTIINNRPRFLIEVEERHKPNALEDVNGIMNQYNYSGFFILNREIISLSEFNLNEYQNSNNIGDYTDNYQRKGIYINNFIFLPNEESDLILKEALNYL
jgi:FkbM family methyltransferase